MVNKDGNVASPGADDYTAASRKCGFFSEVSGGIQEDGSYKYECEPDKLTFMAIKVFMLPAYGVDYAYKQITGKSMLDGAGLGAIGLLLPAGIASAFVWYMVYKSVSGGSRARS